MDFWASWIFQNESDKDPNTSIFNAQFYTNLAKEVVQYVVNWSSHKKWEILSKRMIVLPIHQDHHWSLAAIYNATNITLEQLEDYVSVEVPFIFFVILYGNLVEDLWIAKYCMA